MQKLMEMPIHPDPAHLKSALIKNWSIQNLKLENSQRRGISKAGFEELVEDWLIAQNLQNYPRNYFDVYHDFTLINIVILIHIIVERNRLYIENKNIYINNWN